MMAELGHRRCCDSQVVMNNWMWRVSDSELVEWTEALEMGLGTGDVWDVAEELSWGSRAEEEGGEVEEMEMGEDEYGVVAGMDR